MEKTSEQSILVYFFSRAVEFGNKWMTLSRYVFSTDENIFHKLEGMMFIATFVCIILWLGEAYIPTSIAIIIAILLVQRVIEFVIVYSRNFIFGRGRIFTHFYDPEKRGQWLITMFSMNIIQMVVIFAYWYRLISVLYPRAFIHTLGALDSLYFSIATFITVGGNIYPISAFAKIVTMFQMALTFFTLVIVINGLISIHFRENK
jgi:hypothetical protein